MLYVDFVDQVLAGLDKAATADSNVALIGVDIRELSGVMGIPLGGPFQEAVASATRDLQLMNCAEDGAHRSKATAHGQRIARAGGLRANWQSIFDQCLPLEEDGQVLSTIVELGVVPDASFPSTRLVEMKEALRLVGLPSNQGTAIAATKRLESVGCLHPEPVMTMGDQGMCQVRPTYIGVVVATQKLATEAQTLLDSLVAEWETTSVDVKERLALDSDRQKAEFCKDILALANTRVSGRRFLVLGYNDQSRDFTSSVDPKCDGHRMESILAAYCHPVPVIHYTFVDVETGAAGLIEVESDRAALPYKLSKSIGKLKADSVFVRHNTLVAAIDGEELDALTGEGKRARGESERSQG